jgi:hypothetical protein
MALELNNKSLARKAEAEALDIIAGADDSIHVKAGDTFVGTILAIVIDTPGTITQILAGDSSSTDITAGGLVEGYKNINGETLGAGKFITAGKYLGGANLKSVTTGTATATVYYKYTLDRSA